MQKLPVVPLQTERLVLRAPTHDDIPAIVVLADDIDVVRRLSRLPHPYTEADARYFVDEVAKEEAAWVVTLRETGALAGTIGLRPQDDGRHELGYWYGRRFWGRGLATEAGRAVLTYATTGPAGPVPIRAGHFADNAASARVLRKLGFVEHGRGTHPSRLFGRDLPHVDMVLERQGPRRA